MQAVEFQAQVKDGHITIPEAYQRQVEGVVRVIILTQPHSTTPNLLDGLLENPLVIPNFAPLTRDQSHDRY